ncbi:YrhC family protein [Neobacillus sp. PS3-12]|jgi:predicted MFS family arabinose efflux permease|uniref:YrhC family protein n=1 Tax=Neobacillus sp. PS3-12 TaxID=3070677 RepID=UPI0027E168D6|nr:YrhC family protein [Neobacillus sp. PS3-12]WML54133.1 YrhC family protein [Neobacillus sp. PS3-12]
MKNQAKQLYEKMVDLKRFAVILLAAGVFFYLGVIIPSDTKNTMDVNIMIIASTAFIAVSLLLFINEKLCREKLLAMEESNEILKK